MFDKSDLKAAVDAGVISADQAGRLDAFLKTRSDPDRMLDPENLRFLANFNDIFLTIGLGILLVGVAAGSGMFLGEMIVSNPRMAWVVAVPVLIVSWLLAEYFAGRRRLLLPSMLLTVVICLATASIAAGLFVPSQVEAAEFADGDFDVGGMFAQGGYASLGAALAAALLVHWRFRMAFALFPAALALGGMVYVAALDVGQVGQVIGGSIALVVGLATLAAAIVFDSRDPTRSTVTSDRAFWLHFAAAPQIILGVRGLILGSGAGDESVANAAAMLAVLVGFGLLSLALNRRALIVSGLITFITAVGAIVQSAGGGGVNALMVTALIVGGSIVLLGGGWRTARRWLLKLLPNNGFAGRIFPPEPA